MRACLLLCRRVCAGHDGVFVLDMTVCLCWSCRRVCAGHDGVFVLVMSACL